MEHSRILSKSHDANTPILCPQKAPLSQACIYENCKLMLHLHLLAKTLVVDQPVEFREGGPVKMALIRFFLTLPYKHKYKPFKWWKRQRELDKKASVFGPQDWRSKTIAGHLVPPPPHPPSTHLGKDPQHCPLQSRPATEGS
jgi:hypothetical protein